MRRDLFIGIATLSGTVIGAGFLGIPYAVSKSGFLIGLIWMVFISIMMLLINLMIGEIVLSSKTTHQLPGYSSKYLGKKTKIFVFIASAIGFYAALIAYLIGEGESLSFIFTGSTQYALLAGIIFWIFMAIFTLGGIHRFKKIQPIAVLAVLIVTLILGIMNFNSISMSNLMHSDIGAVFLPFGVVLFAFLGVSSIPEMRRVLRKNQKLMKKAIIIGSLIPLVVYVLFTLIVLGLYGSAVEQIATISFGKIVTLLGIFTMFSAFLALSLAFEDTYRFDFGFSFKKAWILTVLLPLIAFIIIRVFDLAGFVKVLSIGGSISGGLLSIAILLIHEKIKKVKRNRRPEFKIYMPFIFKLIFILIFIAGIVYEFI
jgi:tyrosine-specific transport protein